MLSREQILAARSLPREEVEVPEWGGSVFVSVMSGTERDAWEREISTGGREAFFNNARARLVAKCVTDESGKRLFLDDDIDAIGTDNWLALQRVVLVAQRLNKLTDDELEKEKGNLKPTPGDAG